MKNNKLIYHVKIDTGQMPSSKAELFINKVSKKIKKLKLFGDAKFMVTSDKVYIDRLN